MTGIKILAGVLLVLFLLSQMRLGGCVEYGVEGLFIRLRIGAFWFPVYPLKKEKEKRPPRKTKQAAEPQYPSGGSFELVKRCLPIIGEAAGELRRKIRIDRLEIDFIAAAADAADAALAFGYSNMAMGMIWPVFEQNFVVKEHRFRMAVDFQADSPTIHIVAALSMKLGQLVSFAVRYGWKLLRAYMAAKSAPKGRIITQKEAV